MAYATISDLEAWLAPEPAPANAWRLLEQASDALDGALIGAMYNPDDPDVQAVLTKACVRQVQFMMDRDDETGAQSDVQSMTVGQRSITRRAPSNDSSGSGSGSAHRPPWSSATPAC
jgi:hypothetical protein